MQIPARRDNVGRAEQLFQGKTINIMTMQGHWRRMETALIEARTRVLEGLGQVREGSGSWSITGQSVVRNSEVWHVAGVWFRAGQGRNRS